MAHNQVAVTGLGLVTSLGFEVDLVWKKMLDGESGIKPLTEPINLQGGGQIITSGAIPKFNLAELAPEIAVKKELVRTSARATQFALVAADRAIKDANLPLTEEGKFPAELAPRITTTFALSLGDGPDFCKAHQTFLTRGSTRVGPLTVPLIMPNAPAGHVAINWGAKGESKNITTACSSGGDAVGDGFRLIRNGYADIAIVGGTDDLTHPFYLAAFGNARALSTTGISRPFDALRDGFVMGEGAGVLVLERLEHALARGGKIYCLLVGYGASCDAFHITQPHPDGEGGIAAIKNALRETLLLPTDMDYYNAHGTSTPLNDKTETVILKKVLNSQAAELMISSTKSILGHSIGAAGAIEAIVCCLAIKTGWVHPTINYANYDPECDLDYCVKGSRQAEIKVAGSMSLGFGGHNAFLLFHAL